VTVTISGTLSVSEQEGFINFCLLRAVAAFSPLLYNAISPPDKAQFCSLVCLDRLVGHVGRLTCSQIHLIAAGKKT